MIKILSFAVMATLLIAASAANARGFGASTYAPGQEFRTHGPVAGHPGASGYAPGQLKREHGPVRGHPGASGYAPGHRFLRHY